MTRKDCNWGSTLLRSMSIQFLFRPVLRQLGCPQRLKMGLQRIEKTHAESPNGLFQDSDSVKDTSVLEVAPLSIIRQTHYCETREKGSAAILTPDSFFGWGTSRQRHISTKKYSIKSSPCISAKVSSAIYFHQIQPPWTVTVSEQYRPTNGGTIFPHTHTLSSLLSLFFSLLILIVVMAVLVDSYFNGSFILGDWTIRHQSDNQTFGNTNHSGSMHGS